MESNMDMMKHRIHLFGGEECDGSDLCGPMLQVVMNLFDGGLDYADPWDLFLIFTSSNEDSLRSRIDRVALMFRISLLIYVLRFKQIHLTINLHQTPLAFGVCI